MKIFFYEHQKALPSILPWGKLPLHLAAALSKRGHRVYALLPKYQTSFYSEKENITFVRNLTELGGRVDIVQGYGGLHNAPRTVEIADRVNACSFQWIVNNIFLSWDNLFYMIRHELPVLISRRKRFLGYLTGLAPKGLRIPRNNLPRLIVPTRYLKDELVNAGIIADIISIVPLWVDTSLFSPIDDKTRDELKKKLNLKDRVILFFGGYTALRGINTVIKIFDSIKKERDDVQLVFALWHAPNPFRGYVNLGFRIDLPSIINLADVVCIPLRGTHQMRSIPSTLMEAMSCARAVVSTMVEGVPEIIDNGDDGILVNYETESQVVQEGAQAIIKLLENDTKVRELGEKARQKMLTKYTIEHIAESFESVYESRLS